MPRASFFRTLTLTALVGRLMADAQHQTHSGHNSTPHSTIYFNNPNTKVKSTCQTSTDADNWDCVVPSNLEECGIWLAPSSIPGAGLGMYAGKDFKAGDKLQPSGEVVIPMVDINSHQFQLDDVYLLWDDYMWDAAELHMDNLGFVEVKVASPGFGSAANSFIDLINVDELQPHHSVPNGLHRSRDPGVGAFSTYHDRQSVATVDIKRGEEFFVDYGEDWFRERQQMGPVPLLGDLEKATNLFGRFLEIRRRYHKIRDETFHELWVKFVEHNEYQNTSRLLGAFQKTDSEWDKLHKNMTMKEIRVQEGLRTQEWLREYGTCADNFREGPSTIRQAGRGAFATRQLLKDSIVAPLPLIHIASSSILEMLEFEDIKTLKTEGVRNGMQLILNYCFGHSKSSLLLCPYGPLTSLINHNQTLTNVKVRWAAPSKSIHEPRLLEIPIEQFAGDTAKLAMELVALRDIQPGEEIFLNYGDEWEAAWQEHVRTWTPGPGAKDYLSAYDLDSSPDRLRTEFEQIEQPYPENVDLLCNLNFYHNSAHGHFHEFGQIEVADDRPISWHKCEIIRFREVPGQLLYTAVARVDDNSNKMLTDVPREAFKFLDHPYTADMFLGNAFRHPMMIPDEMFPEYWMNL